MIAGILLFLKGVPAWVWQVLAVIGLLFGIYLYGEHRQAVKDAVKYAALKSEYEAFKADVAAKGKAAQVAADKQRASDLAAKEKADAENKSTVDSLKRTINSLRAQHPTSSFVPAAPPGSIRPDLLCFDRAAYIAADGEFTSEARGLADEGAAATVDLNTARTWANSLKGSP